MGFTSFLYEIFTKDEEDIKERMRIIAMFINDKKIGNIAKKYYSYLCIDLLDTNEREVEILSCVNKALIYLKDIGDIIQYNRLLKKQLRIKSNFIKNIGAHSFKIPNVIVDYVNKMNDVGSTYLEYMNSPEEFIDFIVNPIMFIFEDNIVGIYLGFYTYSKKLNTSKEYGLLDLISRETFSGERTVSNPSIDQMAYEFLEKFRLTYTKVPLVEEGLEKVNKNELIDYLFTSEFLFEDDREDIKNAIEYLYEKNYNTFIYVIVPNIEKILRNILIKNGIPIYKNKDTDHSFQTTLVLTEILKAIRVNNILKDENVTYLENKLNNEEFENYRNRVTHLLDREVFCQNTAIELFTVLIIVLFPYLRDDEYKVYCEAGQRDKFNEIIENLKKKQ